MAFALDLCCGAGGLSLGLQRAGGVGVHARDGIRLHGFGFKRTGLALCGESLESSDSLAWSYNARRKPPLSECKGTHKNCANCPQYALMWRKELLEQRERRLQSQTVSAVNENKKQLTLSI